MWAPDWPLWLHTTPYQDIAKAFSQEGKNGTWSKGSIQMMNCLHWEKVWHCYQTLNRKIVLVHFHFNRGEASKRIFLLICKKIEMQVTWILCHFMHLVRCTNFFHVLTQNRFSLKISFRLGRKKRWAAICIQANILQWVFVVYLNNRRNPCFDHIVVYFSDATSSVVCLWMKWRQQKWVLWPFWGQLLQGIMMEYLVSFLALTHSLVLD